MELTGKRHFVGLKTSNITAVPSTLMEGEIVKTMTILCKTLKNLQTQSTQNTEINVTCSAIVKQRQLKRLKDHYFRMFTNPILEKEQIRLPLSLKENLNLNTLPIQKLIEHSILSRTNITQETTYKPVLRIKVVSNISRTNFQFQSRRTISRDSVISGWEYCGR